MERSRCCVRAALLSRRMAGVGLGRSRPRAAARLGAEPPGAATSGTPPRTSRWPQHPATSAKRTSTSCRSSRAIPPCACGSRASWTRRRRLGFESATIASPDDADWSKAVGWARASWPPARMAWSSASSIRPRRTSSRSSATKGIPVVIGHVVAPEGTYEGLTAWAPSSSEKWGAAAARSPSAKIGGTGTVADHRGFVQRPGGRGGQGLRGRDGRQVPRREGPRPAGGGLRSAGRDRQGGRHPPGQPRCGGRLSTTGAGPVTWAGAAEETGRTVYSIGPDMTRPNLDAVRDGLVYRARRPAGLRSTSSRSTSSRRTICGETVPYANELPGPDRLRRRSCSLLRGRRSGRRSQLTDPRMARRAGPVAPRHQSPAEPMDAQ